MNSSDKQHIMASEAQRLIGVSLAKIAQSRVSRGGVSLHKNLLVATVLQKARYVFMEEAYNIVHGHYPHQQSRQIAAIQRHHQQQQQLHHQQQQQQLHLHYHQQQQQERAKYANNQHQQQQQQQPQYHPHHSPRESLAAAKSSLTKQLHHQHQTHSQQLHSTTVYRHHHQPRPSYESDHEAFEHRDDTVSTSSSSTEVSSNTIADKENISPPESASVDPTAHPADQLTYLDLDTHNKLQRVTAIETSIKRRRVISESETHEAVLSILPKRSRFDEEDEDEDNVFIDETPTATDECETASETNEQIPHITASASTAPSSATPLAAADEPMDTSTAYVEDTTATDLSTYSEPMEIDRISSLVSIFNFGNLSRTPASNVDTCSTQANHQHQPDDGSASSGLHHQHSNMVAMSV